MVVSQLIKKKIFASARPGDKTFTDYGSLPFKQANDVRTFLTFDFDNGAEKIESVIFTSTGGYSEEDIELLFPNYYCSSTSSID